MINKISNKFRNSPNLYYSMSIAATWAGVGSLMMGIEMAQKYGIIPFFIWAFGNTLACIVFGLFAPMIPKLREVFRSRVVKIIVGLMCCFQIWITMNGIDTAFSGTIMPVWFGRVFAYCIATIFIFFLFKNSMMRNVLTDHHGWLFVYVIIIILTMAAILSSQNNMNELSLGVESISVGVEKCILLIPGGFLYPYFFEILDYNDENKDSTKKVNIKKVFIIGGLLFGLYLSFTFMLAWTNFDPVLATIKAWLIVLIGSSTLSSFIYGIYISFGKKVGMSINILTVLLWQLLIPLGVMGVWTLMGTIRIVLVFALIAIALIWHFITKRKSSKI